LWTTNKKILDAFLNKSFYIQIWGEQRHVKPNPAAMKISTKEYFAQDLEANQNELKRMGLESSV
jgi:hypothetical protein